MDLEVNWIKLNAMFKNINSALFKWIAGSIHYSRTSVMWTPKGRTKSVHNSEVSTLVKLDVPMGHRLHTKQTGRAKSVHRDGVSTKAGCPQGGVLLYFDTWADQVHS